MDIGANDPEVMSNSFFFEKCLGWTGLCLEPNPAFASRWGEANRTCEHLPYCAWKSNMNMTFEGSGHAGKIVDSSHHNNNNTAAKKGSSDWEARCVTLESLLDTSGLDHIDLVSIDIEGAETAVLGSFNFSKYDISVFIVETFWLNHRDIDHIFMINGYVKLAQLAIDSVFIKARDLDGLLFRSPLWFPPRELSEYWPKNQRQYATRRAADKRGAAVVEAAAASTTKR